ncbi:adenylosuccinate lyase [Thermodesulfobacteriota bacterium]
MSIKSISPVDGRYSSLTGPLSDFFSEWALIKYRLHVEIEWLIMMSKLTEITHVRALTGSEEESLRSIVAEFDEGKAMRVKDIEEITRHDVKAVEYYIKERLKDTPFEDLSESIHFCCTSEDINNLAYGLMLKDGIRNEWLPLAQILVEKVTELATSMRKIPMLARTHGQAATPTTMGKELAVFVYRWQRQLNQVVRAEYLGKFNGAVGCYNAHYIAYPNAPWEEVSRSFVESLGLTFNPMTTQIESHDYMAELFHALIRFNNITVDFNRDMWTYISLGYFCQKGIKGEVGSSVMPHKVNPIDFENSEANIGVSNSILNYLASKLTVSRLQRDLTDSSALRNIGTAVGHSFVALKSAMLGLDRVVVDEKTIQADLNDSWEVLSEAVQTTMRKACLKNPYEQMKDLTRGKKITHEDIRSFIRTLELPDEDKDRLLALTPDTYIGCAPDLINNIATP